MRLRGHYTKQVEADPSRFPKSFSNLSRIPFLANKAMQMPKGSIAATFTSAVLQSDKSP